MRSGPSPSGTGTFTACPQMFRCEARHCSLRMFLDLSADRAVIYQGSIPNHFCAMVNRNLRILKLPVRVKVSDTQLGDLAGGSADRSLVTFTAGLGIVERA